MDAVTEERGVPPFACVQLRGPAAVEIQVDPGQPLQVLVDAPGDLIDRVITRPQGRWLEIEVDCPVPVPARIRIRMPGLSGLELRGQGTIAVSALQEDKLEIMAHGTGQISAEGRVRKLDIIQTGTVTVRLERLLSEEAFVILAGTGDIHVHATKFYQGGLTGIGDIHVYGNPADRYTTLAGSGRECIVP